MRRWVRVFLFMAVVAAPVAFGAAGSELTTYGLVVFFGSLLLGLFALMSARRPI
ncbi:hypothetical protein GobsT_61750 [Gemmata obscuriglobus]|uniref:hypothetical protein n=1 Tax=Gemmata obscuriglobus TaxID=114 RepID=UPI00016C4730|nr:hypothetical protein [Gemmata obscuriglobus]QEG31354.1 hypothetical protein GobsT_61750 [Gemmata obscuriglobus]VTS10694.1 unnamed protein product [Gemmata obscuriglobus UQM 2246]